MKLTCKLSGLPLANLSQFPFRHLPGGRIYITAWQEAQLRHPVFSLSRWEICQQYHHKKFYADSDSSEQAWLQDDRRLWFLAALHSTGLVQQTVPRLPPAATALRYFHRLIKLLTFLDTLSSQHVADRNFPHLHISKHYEWSSFPGWLEAAEATQTAWNTLKASRQQAERRQVLALLAEKKLREAAVGAISREAYLRNLWRFIANELPPEIKQKKVLQSGIQTKQRTSYPVGSWTPIARRAIYCYYKTQEQLWQELFLCAPAAIDRGDFDKQDIQLLEEHLLTYIEAGSIIAHDVVARINELYNWRNEAASFVSDLEVLGVGDAAPKAIALQKEQEQRSLTAAAQMLTEPQRAAYPTDAAYIVACIHWNKAKKLQAEAKKEGN